MFVGRKEERKEIGSASHIGKLKILAIIERYCTDSEMQIESCEESSHKENTLLIFPPPLPTTSKNKKSSDSILPPG